jgi:hypothetical protein
MAEMAVVVHRHPADIHAHLPGRDGSKGFFLPGKAVVNLEHY